MPQFPGKFQEIPRKFLYQPLQKISFPVCSNYVQSVWSTPPRGTLEFSTRFPTSSCTLSTNSPARRRGPLVRMWQCEKTQSPQKVGKGHTGHAFLPSCEVAQTAAAVAPTPAFTSSSSLPSSVPRSGLVAAPPGPPNRWMLRGTWWTSRQRHPAGRDTKPKNQLY